MEQKMVIPEELAEWLAGVAADEHRSLNGQIVHILSNYRKRVERGPVVIPRGSIVMSEQVA
jgi:hypothetical protein